MKLTREEMALTHYALGTLMMENDSVHRLTPEAMDVADKLMNKLLIEMKK